MVLGGVDGDGGGGEGGRGLFTSISQKTSFNKVLNLKTTSTLIQRELNSRTKLEQPEETKVKPKKLNIALLKVLDVIYSLLQLTATRVNMFRKSFRRRGRRESPNSEAVKYKSAARLGDLRQLLACHRLRCIQTGFHGCLRANVAEPVSQLPRNVADLPPVQSPPFISN